MVFKDNGSITPEATEQMNTRPAMPGASTFFGNQGHDASGHGLMRPAPQTQSEWQIEEIPELNVAKTPRWMDRADTKHDAAVQEVSDAMTAIEFKHIDTMNPYKIVRRRLAERKLANAAIAKAANDHEEVARIKYEMKNKSQQEKKDLDDKRVLTRHLTRSGKLQRLRRRVGYGALVASAIALAPNAPAYLNNEELPGLPSVLNAPRNLVGAAFTGIGDLISAKNDSVETTVQEPTTTTTDSPNVQQPDTGEEPDLTFD